MLCHNFCQLYQWWWKFVLIKISNNWFWDCRFSERCLGAHNYTCFFLQKHAVADLLPLSFWFSGPQSSWEPHLAESSSSRNLWWPGYGDWGGGWTEDQRSFISHVFCAFALHSTLSVWTLSSVPPHRSDWTEEHRQYLLHERSSPGTFQLVRTPIMSSVSV